MWIADLLQGFTYLRQVVCTAAVKSLLTVMALLQQKP
jgi:hypothetical protein